MQANRCMNKSRVLRLDCTLSRQSLSKIIIMAIIITEDIYDAPDISRSKTALGAYNNKLLQSVEYISTHTHTHTHTLAYLQGVLEAPHGMFGAHVLPTAPVEVELRCAITSGQTAALHGHVPSHPH